MSANYEVRVWNITREQALILWELAHEWDASFEGPRFDGWEPNEN